MKNGGLRVLSRQDFCLRNNLINIEIAVIKVAPIAPNLLVEETNGPDLFLTDIPQDPTH